MNPTPCFSVLVPAYNAAPYIAESLRSALSQTCGDFEALVCDDGSTDETFAILRSVDDPRVKLWRRANAGRAAALNFLIDQARAPILVLLDADDRCDARRLEVVAARFARNPELDAVMSGHVLLFGDALVAPRGVDKDPDACRRDVEAFRMPAHDPTLAIRAEVARALRFSEDLRVGAGLDFVLRLGERHRMAVIGESLYHYRVNETSVTRTNIARRAAGVRCALDRARARRGMPPYGDAAFEREQGRSARDPSNNLIGHFIDSAYLQVMAGQRSGALNAAAAALRVAPLGLASLKPLIYAMAPRWLARRLRRS